MALFILYALFVGLVGSAVVGVPGVLMLIAGLQQHSRSRRLSRIVLCGMAAIVTLAIMTWWSISQLQTITPPGSGAPTPDDAFALLKASVAIGLAPGLSCLSAGVASLCSSRN